MNALCSKLQNIGRRWFDEPLPVPVRDLNDDDFGPPSINTRDQLIRSLNVSTGFSNATAAAVVDGMNPDEAAIADAEWNVAWYGHAAPAAALKTLGRMFELWMRFPGVAGEYDLPEAIRDGCIVLAGVWSEKAILAERLTIEAANESAAAGRRAKCRLRAARYVNECLAVQAAEVLVMDAAELLGVHLGGR